MRNSLRNTNLIESLIAIRWYINYSQFPDNNQDPRSVHVQVDPIFYRGMNGLLYMPPWHLAILARELIINSTQTSLVLPHDFRNWTNIANAMNKLKAIENHIDTQRVNQDNVLHIVSKLFPVQQFVWQENRPNKQTLTRYYYIYRNPKLRPIFEKFFGISVEKHFILGTMAWINFMKFLGLDYPPQFDGQFNVTLTDYDKFLKHYSLTFDEMKQRLEDPDERRLDHEFFYYFDSLKKYPMIFTKVGGKPTYICPVPTYLFWRVTDGVYYELCNEKGFDQAIGDGFKDYIGEVLREQAYPETINIIDADIFVKASLPKPDWIFVSDSHAAFIECKAKRMRLDARMDINLSPGTVEQLEKLGQSVVQCYLAIQDAHKQSYEELKFVKKIYPIVVTMENWYVYGDIMAQLDIKAREIAATKGIDEQFINNSPYLVLSSQEFELLSVMLKTRSLEDILEPFFTNNKYHEWQFTSYLFDAFPNEPENYRVFNNNVLDEVLELLKD